MEGWLEKIIAHKRSQSQAVAAARSEELKKRAVFDTKISEFWETVVRALTRTVHDYNQAQEIPQNILEFQRPQSFEVLIRKKMVPSGTLVITLDRQAQCLQCRYSLESESHSSSEETVTFTISGKHIGLPLSLIDQQGGSIQQSSISETILSRFLKAI